MASETDKAKKNSQTHHSLTVQTTYLIHQINQKLAASTGVEPVGEVKTLRYSELACKLSAGCASLTIQTYVMGDVPNKYFIWEGLFF